MQEYTNDQEWRELILHEVRENRKELQEFKLDMTRETAEMKGREETRKAMTAKATVVISLVVSAVVQIGAALLRPH